MVSQETSKLHMVVPNNFDPAGMMGQQETAKRQVVQKIFDPASFHKLAGSKRFRTACILPPLLSCYMSLACLFSLATCLLHVLLDQERSGSKSF
jgi:hypothetical protein